MQGKTVLITGAKGGLGTYVTNSFLNSGAIVAGVSRSIKQSDFPNDSFLAFPAELADSKGALAVSSAVKENLGRIDVLVHLMGGFSGGKSVPETDDQTFEHMFDLNFRSAFYIFRAVLPHMREAGGGRVIAIGSRAAESAAPKLAAYAAFKTALVSLVKSIASENSDRGITANVVLPGTMDTPANRANEPNADYSRWIHPQNVSDLILWLTSDAAAQVSGTVIPVYGREL